MALSKAIEDLKDALKKLPGVGPKTAQRMAFHLMERDREGAKGIADSLNYALEKCEPASAVIPFANPNYVKSVVHQSVTQNACVL